MYKMSHMWQLETKTKVIKYIFILSFVRYNSYFKIWKRNDKNSKYVI